MAFTADEVYALLNKKIKSGGGSGGGGVSSWNDLTDKPFYTTIEDNVTIVDKILPVNENGAILLPKFSLIVGETYMVRWNDVSYTCIAQDVTEKFGTPYTVVSIGNIDVLLGGEGTGEPFIIVAPEAGSGNCEAMSLDGSTSVKIILTGKTYSYHKLDDRFIHSNTVYIELFQSDSDNKYNMGYTSLDIYNMIVLDRKNVILSFNLNGNVTLFYPLTVTPTSLSFQTINISDKLIITELQYLESNGYWISTSKSVNFA